MAWGMLNGTLDWGALNDIAEYLQVEDAELFVDGLMLLEDIRREREAAARNG